MFKNKNWYRVLVPQAVMAVLTLGVFFFCRWMGMEDNKVSVNFAVVSATISAAIATIVILAVIAIVSATTFFASATATIFAAVTAVTAIASAIATFAVPVPIVPIAVFLFSFAFVAFFAVPVVVMEYKLPRYWVTWSYFVEGIIIFFFIFFYLSLAFIFAN